jgi:hypothetical protein
VQISATNRERVCRFLFATQLDERITLNETSGRKMTNQQCFFPADLLKIEFLVMAGCVNHVEDRIAAERQSEPPRRCP